MRKSVVIILLVILAAGGIGLYHKRRADLAKAPVAAVLPVVVDSVTLKRGPVTLTLPALGQVASDLSTTLSTKVSGRITGVFKQEGDPVRKGDKLATIDCTDLVAKKDGLRMKMEGIAFQIKGERENVKALQTSLATAKEVHARTLELLAVQGASREQSSQEEAAISTLEARIAAAENSVATLGKSRASLRQNIREIEAMLAYTVITAPIDGTLSARMAMTGDLATPGKPLFKIAAHRGRYLDLSLPDSVHSDRIILDGRELPLVAKNEAGSTGLARYLAPLPDAAGLVEGQYLNVRVVVRQAEDVLVPVDGLLSVGGASFVFVYADGRGVKTGVEIVARGQEGVVVRPDLAGKTILLAKPDILLRAAAGVPVLVRNTDRPQPKTGGGPEHA